MSEAMPQPQPMPPAAEVQNHHEDITFKTMAAAVVQEVEVRGGTPTPELFDAAHDLAAQLSTDAKGRMRCPDGAIKRVDAEQLTDLADPKKWMLDDDTEATLHEIANAATVDDVPASTFDTAIEREVADRMSKLRTTDPSARAMAEQGMRTEVANRLRKEAGDNLDELKAKAQRTLDLSAHVKSVVMDAEVAPVGEQARAAVLADAQDAIEREVADRMSKLRTTDPSARAMAEQGMRTEVTLRHKREADDAATEAMNARREYIESNGGVINLDNINADDQARADETPRVMWKDRMGVGHGPKQPKAPAHSSSRTILSTRYDRPADVDEATWNGMKLWERRDAVFAANGVVSTSETGSAPSSIETGPVPAAAAEYVADNPELFAQVMGGDKTNIDFLSARDYHRYLEEEHPRSNSTEVRPDATGAERSHGGAEPLTDNDARSGAESTPPRSTAERTVATPTIEAPDDLVAPDAAPGHESTQTGEAAGGDREIIPGISDAELRELLGDYYDWPIERFITAQAEPEDPTERSQFYAAWAVRTHQRYPSALLDTTYPDFAAYTPGEQTIINAVRVHGGLEPFAIPDSGETPAGAGTEPNGEPASSAPSESEPVEISPELRAEMGEYGDMPLEQLEDLAVRDAAYAIGGESLTQFLVARACARIAGDPRKAMYISPFEYNRFPDVAKRMVDDALVGIGFRSVPAPGVPEPVPAPAPAPVPVLEPGSAGRRETPPALPTPPIDGESDGGDTPLDGGGDGSPDDEPTADPYETYAESLGVAGSLDEIDRRGYPTIEEVLAAGDYVRVGESSGFRTPDGSRALNDEEIARIRELAGWELSTGQRHQLERYLETYARHTPGARLPALNELRAFVTPDIKSLTADERVAILDNLRYRDGSSVLDRVGARLRRRDIDLYSDEGQSAVMDTLLSGRVLRTIVSQDDLRDFAQVARERLLLDAQVRRYKDMARDRGFQPAVGSPKHASGPMETYVRGQKANPIGDPRVSVTRATPYAVTPPTQSGIPVLPSVIGEEIDATAGSTPYGERPAYYPFSDAELEAMATGAHAAIRGSAHEDPVVRRTGVSAGVDQSVIEEDYDLRRRMAAAGQTKSSNRGNYGNPVQRGTGLVGRLLDSAEVKSARSADRFRERAEEGVIPLAKDIGGRIIWPVTAPARKFGLRRGRGSGGGPRRPGRIGGPSRGGRYRTHQTP